MLGQDNAELVRSLQQRLAQAPPDGLEADEAAQVAQLLPRYYRDLAAADLKAGELPDLLGAAVAHWRLMRRRLPGQALLRVYNPDQEAHGWRSRDTVVELVAEDMPFLVDSLALALNRRGLAIHLILHPVLHVQRDAAGELSALGEPSPTAGAVAEALLRLHLDRQPAEGLAELERALGGVIEDVRLATGDWQAMRAQARAQCNALDRAEQTPQRAEARAFLDWMVEDHFLFVAGGLFELDAQETGCGMRLLADSALGLFRGPAGADRAGQWLAGIDPMREPQGADLLITKTNARSPVHRPTYLDCVLVRRYDEAGELVGISCQVGLFSSLAYQLPPRLIPVLRHKVEYVAAAAGFSADSYSGRALAHILDGFPRDALFQLDPDTLLSTSLGVLALQERQCTRLFVLRDPFGRFYTCLVYLPRERYSREARLAAQSILVQALAATDVEFETHFPGSALARICFVLRVGAPVAAEPDCAALEARLVDALTTWQDRLRTALFEQMDEAEAARCVQDYAQAFPGGYREDFHPRIAVADIQRIEQALDQDALAVHLYHPLAESPSQLHLRLYSPRGPVSLSHVIPVLEHMGLRVHGERPYRIGHPRGEVWIHDFATEQDSDKELAEPARALFVEAFQRAWRGEIDDDGFNGLVLGAGLSWQQAMLFRAYSRYLHQIKTPYAQVYICAALNRHPAVVRALFGLFAARFDPAQADREAAVAGLLRLFESLLEQVSSLDEDRILRSFLELFEATLRTNFYQAAADGTAKPYLALKLDPRRLGAAPVPRPMFEIFVFSARMEGVHLRGGAVARGGIRWSERMEDYRSEILGLLRAQMVKNSVIVPVGSKGGFVVRDAGGAGDAEARRDRMVNAYLTLLRGMLDLTDNLNAGRVVAPPSVVRRDGDDPYLVIAADRGTAGLSDLANSLAADYGFWLGDAFAAGGSAGYDHKAMGITARGAWESVRRNFRELGRDIEAEPFSVIGIGDMSGDVFGNGMLLSNRIRLLGAFNHEHIFLDPDPDPETSFAERARLFALPGSRWSDYDRGLISAGGGVYPRSAKSVAISPQVASMLDIPAARLAPSDLIRAMLRAAVDLLWNGGIGTFVKASTESHEQAADKGNDALRVDAAELRCKVAGEGGNLGFTPLARVEYARKGGQIYSDAIDNSAGVDCSDHEVNIKILLNDLVAGGDLTGKQRNELLAQMSDDVARLVLADNYAQTQAISVVVAGGVQRLHEQARLVELLEQIGRIDRRLEGLPDRKALTERLAAGQGLTKPEVAVLLAYSRINYFEAIVGSDIPDDPSVREHLLHYFPPVLAERYADAILRHSLRREIVATVISGAVVNRIGPGVGFRVREEVGSDIAGVARAYLVASTVFGTDAIWQQIEALDGRVPAALQIELFALTGEFIERTMTAVLRGYKDRLTIQPLVDRLRDGVRELWEAMPRPLAARHRTEFERRTRRYVRAGVPLDLARNVAGMQPMAHALDQVEVALAQGRDIVATAWIHSALTGHLELDWVRRQIDALAVQTHWHLQARTKLRAALDRHRRDLTAAVLGDGGERGPRGLLDGWLHRNHAMLERHQRLLAEFRAGGVFDFAIMSLIVAGVGELLPAGAGGPGGTPESAAARTE